MQRKDVEPKLKCLKHWGVLKPKKKARIGMKEIKMKGSELSCTRLFTNEGRHAHTAGGETPQNQCYTRAPHTSAREVDILFVKNTAGGPPPPPPSDITATIGKGFSETGPPVNQRGHQDRCLQKEHHNQQLSSPYKALRVICPPMASWRSASFCLLGCSRAAPQRSWHDCTLRYRRFCSEQSRTCWENHTSVFPARSREGGSASSFIYIVKGGDSSRAPWTLSLPRGGDTKSAWIYSFCRPQTNREHDILAFQMKHRESLVWGKYLKFFPHSPRPSGCGGHTGWHPPPQKKGASDLSCHHISGMISLSCTDLLIFRPGGQP